MEHGLREEKARKAKVEVKHFIKKVEPELRNLVEDAEDLEEIERGIIGLENLKEKQNELQMKCEFILRDAYEGESGDKFDTTDNKISVCIKEQTQKIKILKQAAIRKEKEEKEERDRIEIERMEKLAAEKQEKEAREKADNEKRMKDRIDLALHMYDDIKIRAGMFDQKYNISFKDMEDRMATFSTNTKMRSQLIRISVKF